METVSNPDLQTYFKRSREKAGIRLIPTEGAARLLRDRLNAGETVGVVADRLVAGSGTRVEFFGAPARLPLGPAVLALETGAPAWAIATRRVGWGDYRARLAAHRDARGRQPARATRRLHGQSGARVRSAHRRRAGAVVVRLLSHLGGPALMGRADLHIHSLASDGVSSVAEILGAAEASDLDIIALTDHDRIEAALALQALARAHDSEVQIIVGEEVSTRSGHVVALFIEKRIRPWQSLRATVGQIHEQGGLAIIAHPLVPYPLCASGRTIKRLLRDEDARYHPDGMEAFNPTTARMVWSKKAPDFAAEVGLAALPAAAAGTGSRLAVSGDGRGV